MSKPAAAECVMSSGALMGWTIGSLKTRGMGIMQHDQPPGHGVRTQLIATGMDAAMFFIAFRAISSFVQEIPLPIKSRFL